jgi:hypothetical protein
MVKQPLCEMPEPYKTDHRLVAVRAKKVLAVYAMGVWSIGLLQPSQHDMPRDFAWYGTVGEVEAKSKKNPLNLENKFLQESSVFQHKKGSQTISSVNSCSMGSSQSPSLDTVPLIPVFNDYRLCVQRCSNGSHPAGRSWSSLPNSHRYLI